MSRLIPLANWTGTPRATVIFVHGLGGHPYTTWTHTPADPAALWPLWLAEDLPGLAVFSLAYDAPPTNWLGTAMPLLDQAANILRTLANQPALQHGPLVFICHSLGGLIVKQLLRDANEQRTNPTIASLFDRTRLVVFLATPHTGSGKATVLEKLRFVTWPSLSVRDLVANKPELRHLNLAYRDLARADHLRHLTYYEMADTVFGRIVAPDSSDPGLADCRPVAIHANHITIAKPKRRDKLPYSEITPAIALFAPAPDNPGTLHKPTLEPFASDRSWHNLVPALLRLAFLAALAFAAWQGVAWLRAMQAQQSEIVDQGKAAASGIAALSAGQQAILDAVIREKGVPEAPLRAVLSRLDQSNVPAAEIPARLAEAANELIRLRADLARLRNDRPEFAALRARALALIDAGDFDAARAVLHQGRAAARDLRQQYSRTEAAFLADEARVHRLQLNHDAAIANLGEALRLDATNVWIAIDLGDLWIMRGSLANAARAFTAARDAAIVNANDRDLSVAHDKLGAVARTQGDLPAALASYRASLAIDERLAAADPANAEWQRDLSISHNNIGAIARTQGDLQAALTSYRASLAIRERLAAADPANAEWQRDLSISHSNIGDIARTQGDLQAALASYRASHTIFERLAAADPANAQWQRDLSISHNNIGAVAHTQGDLQTALASYRASLAIRERLAAADPANAQWQRDLSISHDNIGAIARTQGDLQAALASYRASLAIRERLAAADPANAEWQRDLSISHDNIGAIARTQGDLQAALASYRASLAISERLAAADPANAQWQRDLSVSHNNIGDIAHTQGDLQTALASYRASLAISERLAAADPANAEWQRDLAISLANTALAQSGPDAAARALPLFTRARAIIARLAAASPTDATLLRDLAWLDAEIARRTP